MTDQLDRELRSLMTRIDEMTPLPPAFDDLPTIAGRPHPPSRERRIVLAASAVVAVAIAGIAMFVATRPDRPGTVTTATPPSGSVATTRAAPQPVVAPDDIVGLWVFTRRAVPVDENRVGTGAPMPSPLPAYRYEPDGTVRGFDGCNRNVSAWQLENGTLEPAETPPATAAATAIGCPDTDVPVTVAPVPQSVSFLARELTLVHEESDGSWAWAVRVDDLPAPDSLTRTSWTLGSADDDVSVSFRGDGTVGIAADATPCAAGTYSYGAGLLEMTLVVEPNCRDDELDLLASGPLVAASYTDSIAADTVLLASDRGAVRLFPAG